MSQIRSKNTKPELLVRSFLHKNGFRFRIHRNDLPGKPDIVFKKYKTAIFVNGCFWHGHKNCKYFIIPKTRTEFWTEKISTNTLNDKKNITLLRRADWKVLVVWECQLKRANTLKKY